MDITSRTTGNYFPTQGMLFLHLAQQINHNLITTQVLSTNYTTEMIQVPPEVLMHIFCIFVTDLRQHLCQQSPLATFKNPSLNSLYNISLVSRLWSSTSRGSMNSVTVIKSISRAKEITSRLALSAEPSNQPKFLVMPYRCFTPLSLIEEALEAT